MGDGVGDLVGFGDFVGDGVGDGTGVCGPTVYPAVVCGTGNALFCKPSRAVVMKSWKIAAGIVPPKTGETPSTPSNGVLSFFGYPTQTHVASCGVYP